MDKSVKSLADLFEGYHSPPDQVSRVQTRLGDDYHIAIVFGKLDTDTQEIHSMRVPNFQPGDIIVDREINPPQKVLIVSGEKGNYQGYVLNKPDQKCTIHVQYDGVNWLVQYLPIEKKSTSPFQILDI